MKPGYKQTEVGVIPVEWEVAQLSRLAEVRGGIAKNSKVEPTDAISVHYLRVANVQDGFLDLSEMNKIHLSRHDLPRYKVLPGDVLMNEGGDLDKLGRGAIWRGDFDPCVHQNHVFVVRCKAALLAEYLNVWTATSPARRFFLLAGKQTTNLASISKTSLGELPVALPPLPEQRAIATALSDVDGLLGGLDRLIAKKRDLKQAAMQQLLTGQTRLPGFHGEWADAQVQDVITGFFCGPSPTCEERNIHDDEWGVLKTTASTKENGWDWTKHKTLPRVFWNKPQIELKKGDVIVTKAGPRHRVGVTAWIDYVPPRIIPSGKMIALRPNPDRVVPLMLAAAIAARNAQTYLDQRTTGMAESQVNFENVALLEAPIELPRIEEQTAIASVLTEMDGELATLEQRREKTLALKQAMMQELLTGKMRLL